MSEAKQDQSREWKAVGVAGVVTVAALIVWALGWWVMWVANVRLSPDPIRDARIAAEEAQRLEIARVAALGPPGAPLDPHAVARGLRLYAAACIACHGPEARGVPKMGKDLVEGSFTRKSSDAELVKMIALGRDITDPRNTTKMPMPARGGRTDFTDAHLADIVTYLRSLQDPRRITGPLPEVEVAVLDAVDEPVTPVTGSGTGAPATTATSTPAGTSGAVALDADAVKRGKRVFASCMTCHGRDGTGVKMMGADLLHSEFVKSKTDEELVEFIKKGRQPGDPESKMNLNMPAKGGNPSLKDNQLQDVVVYIRSLQQAASGGK